MFGANPKKEVTVNYSLAQVKEAVHKIIANDPKYYVLVKDDTILNTIRIHQKGVLLDMGYHIDFDFKKISDSETQVLVEVSRNAGAINTAGEVSIANNSLKTVLNQFSAFLSGEVDEKGKPKIPANTGCLLFFVIGSIATLVSLLV